MSKAIMLSTKDNPFNPFTHFNEWNQYDKQMGYHTNAYLARLAHTSYELTEEENVKAIEKAMDDIISTHVNLLGGAMDIHYIKVYEDEAGGGE